MNKAGLWEGMKNWLEESIPELCNTLEGKKMIEAEALQKVLEKMREYEKELLQ
jgi:uncharacterized protein YlzI (FlbEa/FlbD family)